MKRLIIPLSTAAVLSACTLRRANATRISGTERWPSDTQKPIRRDVERVPPANQPVLRLLGVLHCGPIKVAGLISQ